MAIDPEALDEYREVLGEEFAPFFVDLIDTFFSSGPEYIQNMKNALTNGDDELFTRTAHTLKSNCKTFGAHDFAELAYELEMLGNEKDLEEDIPEKVRISNPTRLTELKNQDILVIGDGKLIQFMPLENNRLLWFGLIQDLIGKTHFT